MSKWEAMAGIVTWRFPRTTPAWATRLFLKIARIRGTKLSHPAYNDHMYTSRKGQLLSNARRLSNAFAHSEQRDVQAPVLPSLTLRTFVELEMIHSDESMNVHKAASWFGRSLALPDLQTPNPKSEVPRRNARVARRARARNAFGAPCKPKFCCARDSGAQRACCARGRPRA